MSVTAHPRHPITGRRLSLTARTPAELAAYMHRLASLRTELRLGMRTTEEIDRELRHLRHGPVVFERAALAYLARPNLAANTKKRVRSLIDKKRGGHLAKLLPLPVSSLDAPTLSTWIASLESAGLHGTSIGTIWRTLRAIVRHAAEKGWIGASPWGTWRPRLRGTAKRELREAVRSPYELVTLLDAAAAIDNENFQRTWLAPLIGCAALLGLRQGELAGLRWSDVEIRADGAAITVLVARQWDGKPLKGSARPMRIEADAGILAPLLEDHRARMKMIGQWRPDGPIFPKEKTAAYTSGQPLTSLNLRACVRRAGLPHVASWSPHSLRDSFVTLEAIATGGDLPRVAERSRHANLTTLVRYLRARTRTVDAPNPSVSTPPRAPTDSPAPDHDPPRLNK